MLPICVDSVAFPTLLRQLKMDITAGENQLQGAEVFDR